MGKSYAGKVTNNGTQMAKALIRTPPQVKPKVQKGGDLRGRPSAKK